MFTAVLAMILAQPPQSTLPDFDPPKIEAKTERIPPPKTAIECGMYDCPCGCYDGKPCTCKKSALTKLQAYRREAKAAGVPLIVFVGDWVADDKDDLEGCLAIRVKLSEYDAPDERVVIEPADGGVRHWFPRGRATMKQVADKALGHVTAPVFQQQFQQPSFQPSFAPSFRGGGAGGSC